MRDRVFLASALCAVLVPSLVYADASGPTYSFNVLSIGEGPNSFAEQFPGDDLLPYTDDDFAVAGNPFGSFGVTHMDINSDNKISDDEHILHVVRNSDDDSTFLSPQSRPEYGTIYESEDWNEDHDARLEGPHREAVLKDTNLTDFEINDWNGWTDESNAYLYNNLGANQRGLGHPKYRVDYRSVPLDGQDYVFDEVEGFKKSFGLRNKGDNPDTPFNEKGGCTRFTRPRDAIDLRGYLVPVEDLEDLEDGSMPPLFPGWMEGSTTGGEPTDTAGYLRDVVAPLLDDPNLFTFSETGLGPEVLLPPSYVYLMQLEIVLELSNLEGECGGSDDVECAGAADPGLCGSQMHAAGWGLVPGSTFRRSFLAAGSPELADLVFGDGAVHLFQPKPDDDEALNLWVQDHFWRDGNEPLGLGYTTVGDLDIVQEPGLSVVDTVNDSVLRIMGAGSISAAISKPLGAGELPILLAADLALDVADLGPGGAGIGGGFQLIVRSDNNVIAYADINGDETQVHLGGTYDPATGRASGAATSGPAGGGADLTDVDTVAQLGGDYSRYVLSVTSVGATLHEITGAIASDYVDLRAGAPAAAVLGAPDLGDGANAVSVTAAGQSVVNTLLVFASPGTGPFNRGDCNRDFSVDLSDGVSALGYAFLGDAAPGCLAACDFNGDGLLNITNAVYFFSALFSGGPAVPGPRDAFSQRASDAALGCGNG